MLTDEPKFLTVEEVARLNAKTIERFGGTFGIRENGYLLESAVMTPQQRVFGQWLHPTLEAMAGAYLFHICQNHPFEDGNKRTALHACDAFLRRNGKELTLTGEQAEDLVRRVASSEMKKEALLDALADKTRDLKAKEQAQKETERERLQSDRVPQVLVQVERGENNKTECKVTRLQLGETFDGHKASARSYVAFTDIEMGREVCIVSKSLDQKELVTQVKSSGELAEAVKNVEMGQERTVHLQPEHELQPNQSRRLGL